MKRHLFYLITVVALNGMLAGCGSLYSSSIVSGQATPTTQKHFTQTTADQVTLYEIQSPKHYQIIGSLRVENTYTLGLGALAGMKHSEHAINAKLKTTAASLGANGIIQIKRGDKVTTGSAVISK